MLVKQLLYTEKYTIDGARQKVDRIQEERRASLGSASALDSQRSSLWESELRSILAILDGQPEEKGSRVDRAAG